MKGVNHLKLNEATLVEALQEYFDKRGHLGQAAFNVTSVAHESSPLGSWFTARTKGREDDES